MIIILLALQTIIILALSVILLVLFLKLKMLSSAIISDDSGSGNKITGLTVPLEFIPTNIGDIPLRAHGPRFLLFGSLSCGKCIRILDGVASGVGEIRDKAVIIVLLDADSVASYPKRWQTCRVPVADSAAIPFDFKIRNPPLLVSIDPSGTIKNVKNIIDIEDLLRYLDDAT